MGKLTLEQKEVRRFAKWPCELVKLLEINDNFAEQKEVRKHFRKTVRTLLKKWRISAGFAGSQVRTPYRGSLAVRTL